MSIRRRDPFGPATTTDIIRALFHALVAGLFTAPMWILVLQLVRGWPELLGNTYWLIAASNGIVWGVPFVTVVYRWRQQIYEHPERSPSALIRTYAYAQMAGVLSALPILLWFGWGMLNWSL